MGSSKIESHGISSRLYAGEADLQNMLDLLMQGRSRTNDWHYAHIGELLWNYFMLLCHLDPCQHIRLWHAGDQLVAFAILGEDPTVDVQVLLEYEWDGIEEEAFIWADALLANLRQQDSQNWSGNLVSGARQDDSPRLQFLEQHGFRYVGRFAEVNMLRWLDDTMPDLPVPEDFHVREVSQDEIADRAAAQHDVWQPWSVGNVTQADYLRFIQLPMYRGELDVVTVTPEGVIAAYVNGWIDPLNHIGDIGPVGARLSYRRQGCTRLALLECLHRMQALGMDRVCISTGIHNTPARRLYESLGFKVVNQYLDFEYAQP
jgi:ribosomal protein S18 acetylase RimI-like enzyme